MNSNLIKQLNQLNETIQDVKKHLETIQTTLTTSDDIKCSQTITTNNLTVNNLSQLLGNLNILGNIVLDNNKIYFNDSCYLFVDNNKLYFHNPEKDYCLTE